jgi:DnaJ-class molecular chaperone
MYIAEKVDCPQCSGKGTVRLEDRTYAICSVCAGRGAIQQHRKLDAAQILGMIWRADQQQEVKYAVNSGAGGNPVPSPTPLLRKEEGGETQE